MPAPIILLQSFLICGTSWILWRFFRQIIVKSPLDNVPGPEPVSFWKGNLPQVYDRRGWGFYEKLGYTYGQVVKLYGMFGHKMLYVYDPLALHSIIVKDQYVYEEAAWFVKSNELLFGPGLLASLGDHHRKQRKMLNPVFSIAHMRHMTPIFYRVTHKLESAIMSRVRDGPGEVDILNWMGRTALELIGQGGLGYSFDPLEEDVPDVLGDALKAFMPTFAKLQIHRRLIPYFAELGSPRLRRWILDMIPDARIQKMKYISDTVIEQSWKIFNEKKAALVKGDEAVVHQIGEGKDIMSILMKANMNASAGDKLPEDELIAQMSMLTLAAMDTTSNALSRTLHLLSEHQDVQEKLRAELMQARDGKDISYDDLVHLPFLDAVCRETLRRYPPAPWIFRVATKDIMMPLSEPVRGVNGTMMHEILVPEGTTIQVGIMGSNWNKAIWGEDAMEWRPERWLSPLPSAVEEAKIPGVYSNLMTFLGGGRACIGFKFSQIEMKTVLSVLLTTFKFSLPKEKIEWNMAGVTYPTTGDDVKARMLLTVEPLEYAKITVEA
ncbi:cytochrome P450 [Obba rivulosa]|uniref:Cytochrome P450 n=1 Tax=Obba rivulosa TaxID=1052685 RepID=A0A8E2J424_9APHY|nr:cytochrome P450 [Obba rivulosa]